MNTKKMTLIALMTAIMCILGPVSIPIGPIPISFTNLAIYLAVYLIGTKYATCSYLIYYLLGIFGLPVFSGFQGGFSKAVGPTGGCLIGFFFMAVISGIFIEKFRDSRVMQLVGMILGTIAVYTMATLWFSYVMSKTIVESFFICVAPFIIGDLIKMVIAMKVGSEIMKRVNIVNPKKK